MGVADNPQIHDQYFGRVPPGWKRESYIAELKRMIEVCRVNRPDRAEYWSQWLDQLTLNDRD